MKELIKCSLCSSDLEKKENRLVCVSCKTEHKLIEEKSGNLTKARWIPILREEKEKPETVPIQQVTIDKHETDGKSTYVVNFYQIKVDRVPCPHCGRLQGIMFQLKGKYETVCVRCKSKILYVFNLQ